MKNLIIDIEKHFPSLERILDPADYYSPFIPLNQMIPLQPLPDEVYCRDTYGIEPVKNWEQLSDEYETVAIVFPVHSFDDPGYTTNIEERRNFFEDIYKKLESKKIRNIIFFDGSDRAIVKRGLNWLDSKDLSCDFVFKREYRTQFSQDYDDRVLPFPFAVFGKPNPSFLLYEKKITNTKERANECFWAGATLKTDPIYNEKFPDEKCDRMSFLQLAYPYLVTKTGLNHSSFLQEIANHKFFLNLNGTGHLCKRFFEGLSTGSLMMMQRTDLVFPFEKGEFFSEETLFSTPEEFVQKLLVLKQDENLYQKCLQNQNYIVEKYFNYKWIREYINSKINQKK